MLLIPVEAPLRSTFKARPANPKASRRQRAPLIAVAVLKQRQRPPREEVGGVAAGVLVALVAYGGVTVPQERRLLDQVGHGAPVALRSDLEADLLGRHGRVRPRPLLPVGLGLVYGPKQPEPVAPRPRSNRDPPLARRLLSAPAGPRPRVAPPR